MTLSSFSSNHRTANSATVSIDCELVRGNDTQILEALLPRVQQRSLTLDLSSVERIDAAGIATLITLYCTAVEKGTRFSVVSPSHHVLELLRLVGLESILVSDESDQASSENKFDHSTIDLACSAA